MGRHLAVLRSFGVIRLVIIVYNRFNITREYRYFCVVLGRLALAQSFALSSSFALPRGGSNPRHLGHNIPRYFLNVPAIHTLTFIRILSRISLVRKHYKPSLVPSVAFQQFLGDFLVSFGLTSGGGGGGPTRGGPVGGPGGPPIGPPGRPMGPPGGGGPSPIGPGGPGGPPGGGGPHPPMGPNPGSSIPM